MVVDKEDSENIKIIMLIIMIAFCLYLGTVKTIQRFKCPEMTSTQLFLCTYDTILLNFKECK